MMCGALSEEWTGLSFPILESESELLYDRRFSAYQFVLATSLLRHTTSNFIFKLNTCGYSPYVTSSRMRGWGCRLQLLLVLASAITQVRVPRDSWPHFTISDSGLSQPVGPGPRIYIPQEQGSPFIPPGTGFICRRLLRLAGYGGGIRPRPHNKWRYILGTDHAENMCQVSECVARTT
jgi:hypothetical protein